VLSQSGRVSPELETLVRNAAKALNYQPNRAARALRARQGTTVGVLIPDIQNLFFTAIVRGIDDEIQKHGYTVLLANSDGSTDRERVYLNTFRAEGVAGLLVVPSQDDERIYRDFLRTGVPLVVLDRTVHLPNVDLVSVTNAEGSAQAVAHLVELGHRRIAMIAGLEAHNVGAERRRGSSPASAPRASPSIPRSSAMAASSARRPGAQPTSCSASRIRPRRSSARTTRCPSACCRRSTSAATVAPTTCRSSASTTCPGRSRRSRRSPASRSRPTTSAQRLHGS